MTEDKLESLQIRDRIEVIMQEYKIYTMKTFLDSAHEKCHIGISRAKNFKQKFKPLIQIGLPSQWNKDGIIYSFQVYIDTFDFKKRTLWILSNISHLWMERSLKKICSLILSC